MADTILGQFRRTFGYVWDAGTMAWVKETQAGGAGGGGTEYTEDAPAAADPVAPAVILVRADTPGTITSTDGDNVAQRGSNYGAAYVTLVDSAGGFVAVGGGSQYTEDAVPPADPIGTAHAARRRDTLGAETGTDGDWVVVNATNKGEIYVKHVDAISVNSGVGVTDNGGSLTVDGPILSDMKGVLDSIKSNTDPGQFTHQEDHAAADQDYGIMALGVRKDNPDTTADTNGDYASLTLSNKGALWVALEDGAGNKYVPAAETGGNLASAATSLAIIDDWDETDRAKVNPIAGQAGVQGASGLVTALTQRVVLATDVALPTGANAIGKLAANAGVDIGAVELVAGQTLATVTTVAAVTAITNALPAGTNYIGRTRDTDGTLDMTLLNSAPASDTSQVAMPVRVISQLGGSVPSYTYA